MSTVTEYKYLERDPNSSLKQLSIKGVPAGLVLCAGTQGRTLRDIQAFSGESLSTFHLLASTGR